MSDDYTDSNKGLHAGLKRSSIPADRLDYSFRTTAEGNISLTRDWTKLLERMRWLSHFFVQVDHAHARMSMRLKRNDYEHSLNGTMKHNGLSFQDSYAGWTSATARIAKCKCCESVGHAKFTNPRGTSFMQMTAPSDVSALEWATLLSGIESEFSAVEDRSKPCTSYAVSEQLRAGAVDLHVASKGCVRIFNDLADIGLPLEFTNCAAEVQMRQSYVIHGLRESKGIVECSGSSGGFSLFLPAVDASHVMFEEGRMTWILVDVNGRILFKVRAKLNAGVEDAFQSLLGF